MVPADVAAFGDRVVGMLRSTLGADLVGTYFVGSIALGGYIAGESDIDIVAVCEHRRSEASRRAVARSLSHATIECPTRGLELTLYRREVASSPPVGADFEVNANGGSRMASVLRVTPDGQPVFSYSARSHSFDRSWLSAA